MDYLKSAGVVAAAVGYPSHPRKGDGLSIRINAGDASLVPSVWQGYRVEVEPSEIRIFATDVEESKENQRG